MQTSGGAARKVFAQLRNLLNSTIRRELAGPIADRPGLSAERVPGPPGPRLLIIFASRLSPPQLHSIAIAFSE